MITSTQNAKIKWIRSLQASSRARRQESVIVVEGVRLVEEALTANWKVQLLLHTDQLNARGKAVLEGYITRGATVETVTERVMRAASTIETPQGLLAVLDRHSMQFPASLNFVFVPDGVRDPGNLGTMLRTAAAAGLDAVLIPPGSVDAFAPKVLRAGMGAHFRLPVQESTWEQIEDHLKPLRVFLAEAGEGTIYSHADFRSSLAIIVGGEAGGAGQDAQRLADTRVHIPMPGGSESLNAAVAAAVLMFEVVRQRQN